MNESLCEHALIQSQGVIICFQAVDNLQDVDLGRMQDWGMCCGIRVAMSTVPLSANECCVHVPSGVFG